MGEHSAEKPHRRQTNIEAGAWALEAKRSGLSPGHVDCKVPDLQQ